MSRKRIKIILFKEWRVIYSDMQNVFLSTVVPLLIMAEGVLYVWLADHFGGSGILTNPFLHNSLDKFLQAFPQTLSLTEAQQVQLFFLYQFNFFLLLIPTVIAISFATFSIVDEKTSRSLEPLLATPVRTWELLLAKAVSGAIPALIVTWINAGLFLAGVQLIGWGDVLGYYLSPTWYIVLFWLVPAVVVLSFLLGVIGSSRAKDARGAMNLAIVIILPVFALIAIQVTGLVWFTTISTVVLSAVITIVDYLVLRLAVRLFRRETIIIGWK
jgi:ABC-2 type transport system permease protein